MNKLCKNQLHYYGDNIRQCLECKFLYQKSYYKNNRDKLINNVKDRYYADPEKHKAKKRLYTKNNKEKISKLKKNYYHSDKNRAKGGNLRKYWPGTSPKEALVKFTELLNSQNGVCAICKNEDKTLHPGSKKHPTLSVDHCHETGIVRGLLCGLCNKALGGFKDNVIILEEACNYLKRHRN